MRSSFLASLALGVSLFALPAAASETLEDPSRLVAIGGSLVEIIYALGEESHLVARDQTALYPPEALELPDVGYMRALSPEGVLSVNPSAILSLEGAGPVEAIDVLTSASVPFVFVSESFDRAGVVEKVRAVGVALDETGKADGLIAEIEADFDALEALVAHVDAPKRVLFIISLANGRVNASGTGTAADGMIALAGAVNAVTDYEGYRQLTEEAIIEAQPDFILMMDREGDHGASVEELASHPALSLTPAGQNRAIIQMDGAYLLGFGPRTAAAARDLAAALYGDDLVHE